MHTIQQILDLKGGDVWSVAPEDPVYEAIRRMAELGVGALLVMDGARLVGILSERDYARRIILEGRTSRDTRVEEIMTADPITITRNATADHGLAVMNDRRIRHLPVTDDGHVIGLVSIGDLVSAVLEDQKQLIDQLQQYVSS